MPLAYAKALISDVIWFISNSEDINLKAFLICELLRQWQFIDLFKGLNWEILSIRQAAYRYWVKSMSTVGPYTVWINGHPIRSSGSGSSYRFFHKESRGVIKIRSGPRVPKLWNTLGPKLSLERVEPFSSCALCWKVRGKCFLQLFWNIFTNEI